MRSGLTIRPAKTAGFVVTNEAPSHMANEILFAGSLSDCLGYVERELDCIHHIGGDDDFVRAA